VENSSGRIFEIEQEGEAIVVVVSRDLRELEYERIEADGSNLLELLDGHSIKNVVLDFHKTDFCGSTALGFFLKLWKRVRMRDGLMAFCNVSDHEREIFQVTKLDQLWAICSSRKEALKAVTK